MAEDENKTDSESDVLLQGAESVVSTKGSDDAPFDNLSLDSDLLKHSGDDISRGGRTSLPIKALMQLTQGSVVELDRLAGEALDLLVNNTLVAQGEIVLVNERYGIRLTQIVPKSARLKLGQAT